LLGGPRALSAQDESAQTGQTGQTGQAAQADKHAGTQADTHAGTAAAPAVSACITCHADPARMPDPALRDPVALYADDVHAARGLACHDCHGGDPAADAAAPDGLLRAHDPGRGYLGRPEPAEGPAFCGRCHSDAAYMARYNPDARVDQALRYATSVHGQRLAGGDTKVAACIACHGRHAPDEDSAGHARAFAHGIRAVSDPLAPVYPTRVAGTCGRCHADADYMQEYGIPTSQVEEYEESVHHAALMEREDLSAPTCNDCHGNHGARPPEVESMAFVCGTCHGRQSELFRQSSMKPAFDELDLGECIVCHANHAILPPHEDMLFHEPLPDDHGPTGCYLCHMDADDPALAASAGMRASLVGLAGRIAEAQAVLAEAHAKGMPVAQAEFELTGATDALIEARALVHLFRAGPVEEAAARGVGVADETLSQGRAAIADYFFRHRWLGVSLLGIAFVIVSLWLKLRSADRRWREAARAE
jgi:hypothetical protein